MRPARCEIYIEELVDVGEKPVSRRVLSACNGQEAPSWCVLEREKPNGQELWAGRHGRERASEVVAKVLCQGLLNRALFRPRARRGKTAIFYILLTTIKITH